MELHHGIHLGYCTNIHRGETWEETFGALQNSTLAVRDLVSEGRRYGIGLRLSAAAAATLATGGRLDEFKRWLHKNECYVFTINGFPYGRFHGGRVKEQVYAPDWTTPERAVYTKQLFEILAELVPEGMGGSVSTLPGSFKEFITDDEVQGDAIIDHLADVCGHVRKLRERTGKDLHLGLEPEPLGWFETTAETVAFFERFRRRCGSGFDEILGVNYDTCHLAVEFEGAAEALGLLKRAGIRVSKLHLSSALKLVPTAEALVALKEFEDDVYLHQVVERRADGSLARYRDLPPALAAGTLGDEWRIHFHVPLHAEPEAPFGTTRDHLEGALDVLADDPQLCQHLEMETYTWEVLPASLRSAEVVDQLANEYRWTLAAMRERGLA